MRKTTKSLLITSLILFCTGILLALGSALFVKIKGIDPYGVVEKQKVIEDKKITLSELIENSPESNFAKKLSPKEFLRIDLSSFTGDVIIRSGDETGIELKKANTANLTCSIIGETLTIAEQDEVGIMGVYINDEGFAFKGLRHIFGPGNSANLKKVVIVNIAKDFHVDQIDVNSKIGDITIDGVSATTLNVTAKNGNVELKNLPNVDGKITVKGDTTDVDMEDCFYNSCNISVKIGNVSADVLDLRAISTVLESWIGDVEIETDLPTTQYKLTLSSTFGSISRNGKILGKDCKESAENASRITATALLGSVSLDFEGGDESLYVPVDTEPVTNETPQTTDAPPVS